MRKIDFGLFLLIVLVILIPPVASTESEIPEFGRFAVIRGDAIEHGMQYTVYDKQTKIVYIYTVGDRALDITPYLMRNVFGELTVGIYDAGSGVIMPMEPYLDEDGSVWKIAG